MALDVDTVFDFDLNPTLASQRKCVVNMGFLCQLSERTCFFNVREFWRSMLTTHFRWVPLLFRGAADVAAFSGYSFGLLQKSTSP